MKTLSDYIVESEQTLSEKAMSQKQQKFMDMVHTMQNGKKGKGATKHKKEFVPMDEDRTEVKDKDGNVTSWKDEGKWKKSTANKDGRGKVTNLSDKARRETEKLFKKEKDVTESITEDLYDDEPTPVESAILGKIMRNHANLLSEFGPEEVMAAAQEVALMVGSVNEIGTSDASGWVKQVIEKLRHSKDGVAEGWNDHLDDPDSYEDYLERLRDLADVHRKEQKEKSLGSEIPVAPNNRMAEGEDLKAIRLLSGIK